MLLNFSAQKDKGARKKTKHVSLGMLVASLAVWLFKLKYTGRLSFHKLMLRPFCEGNKVKFELWVLGDEFIAQEHTLNGLLGKPQVEPSPIDSFGFILNLLLSKWATIFETKLYPWPTDRDVAKTWKSTNVAIHIEVNMEQCIIQNFEYLYNPKWY